jgi:type III pantothenate kinase
MLLVFDIGNTTMALGLFKAEKIIEEARFSTSIAADPVQATNEINKFIEKHRTKSKTLSGVAICSVVPSLTETIAEIAQSELKVKAWIFDHTVRLGMKICYDDPSQLGPDRLANAVAAKILYGTPAIVVDLGTASKFEVINGDGDYLGGAIAPGISISAHGLFEKAARLFPVDIEKPDKVIATNTTEAMKSGIFYGAIGQVDYMIEKIMAELGEKDIKVIATGGLADKFASQSIYIQKNDPHLTFQGIRIGFQMSN